MSRENYNISEEHLMAYLLKEADEQLVRDVEHWLALSEENVVTLNELEATWVESGKLRIKPVAVDVDAAWHKLSEKMDADEKPVIHLSTSRRDTSKIVRTITRVAAVVILGAGLWAIRNAILTPKLQILATENSVEEVDLSDGSRVNLNENTTIKYPEKFTENSRELQLEGEAFFKIAPDKKKPFIIRSDDAYIKVLGTSFNVKALNESRSIEVYVEEGIVMLYTISNQTMDTASVILYMGETGVYDKQTREVKKVGKTDIEVMYWLNKTLIFEETDLSRVFEILSITYDVTINVQDSTVNSCRMNATFKNEQIDYILEVIAITFGLEVEKTKEQTYYIKGEGCKY